MIPRIVHVVWVGDESRRPERCLESWRRLNPSYEVRVWGNQELMRTRWVNAAHIREMGKYNLAGVADMMRYEILYRHGGITVDADSECLRPLEDWLMEPTEWATWENEHLRPGLITNAFLGSVPESPFFGQLIASIHRRQTVVDANAWITTGPTPLTETWKAYQYPLTIYPSHYFTPNHFSGLAYEGAGQVFARQLWSTTRADIEGRGFALPDFIGVAS